MPDSQACPAEWTEGLPGIAPTESGVHAMLGVYLNRSDEVVAEIAPGLGHATWRLVAANAVIAGCTATDLPAVVAGVRAVTQPRFLLDQIVTTVHGLWPMFVLSHNAAPDLASGRDCLSGSSGANARIARAISLVLRNVGGGHPDAFDVATMGRPGKLMTAVVENPSLSPWQPWFERRDPPIFDPALAAYAADSTLCIADMGHTDAELLASTIADSIAIPGTYNAFFRKDLWLLLSPTHAWMFADAGWTPADIASYMFDNACQPYSRLRGRGLFGFIDEHQAPRWLTPEPPPTEMISIVDAPRRVQIAVVGAETGGYTTAVFGSGVTCVEVIER
jgi:hypothetical protein